MTENLDAPWSIAFHGGTPLVSERDSARILELDDAGQARGVAVVRGVVPQHGCIRRGHVAAARATHRPTLSRMRCAAISSLYGD
ncbi:hypothetical protein [Kocuria marina]|uniref:hypothetical protein n=1 Tax=Kocuria marina TaxID=223184 RepID=UPI001643D1BB|nr:hypothetical protein [Kocuria indica]